MKSLKLYGFKIPKMLKIMGVLGAGCLIVVLVILLNNPKKNSQDKTVAYIQSIEVTVVELADKNPIVSAYGRLKATQRAELIAEGSGKILRQDFRLKTGTVFSKGDRLMQIEHDEQRYNLYQIKSQFLNNLTQLVSDLGFDFPNRKRIWTHYLKEFDLNRSIPSLPNVTHSKEKYFLHKRQIYQSYYSIKSAEARMLKYIVTAPYDGQVAEAFPSPYTYVKTGQKLGVLVPNTGYECEVNLPLDKKKWVRQGQRVVVSAMDSDLKWKGSVIGVSPAIREGDYLVPVIVGEFESESDMVHNQYVSVAIEGIPILDSVMIDQSLLIENKYVYIAKKEKSQLRKMKTEVTPQYTHQSQSIIVGLETGQLLLNDLYRGINEGDQVTINSTIRL